MSQRLALMVKGLGFAFFPFLFLPLLMFSLLFLSGVKKAQREILLENSDLGLLQAGA